MVDIRCVVFFSLSKSYSKLPILPKFIHTKTHEICIRSRHSHFVYTVVEHCRGAHQFTATEHARRLCARSHEISYVTKQ